MRRVLAASGIRLLYQLLALLLTTVACPNAKLQVVDPAQDQAATAS